LFSYLLGSITGVVAAKAVKPVLRSTLKTTIGIGLDLKKRAAEAAEELQDIVAEAAMEAQTRPAASPTSIKRA